VGSDTIFGLGYTYNADDLDEGGGYGAHPPALGVHFVQGALADTDGRDNDLDGRIDEPEERMGMTNFMLYHGGGGPRNDPGPAQEFYTYMQSIWRNGEHLTYGGGGYDASDIPADFMFPGDPVTNAFWSE